MSDTRQFIPVAGLLLTFAIVSHHVVRLDGQQPPTGDFTNAATAEVRDANGQVVLRGQFAASVEDDDGDLERKAALAPTGAGTTASGKAEVEFAKDTPAAQEIEFSVTNLAPGARFTFVIDGREVATATTDRRGHAEAEVDVNTSAVSRSR